MKYHSKMGVRLSKLLVFCFFVLLLMYLLTFVFLSKSVQTSGVAVPRALERTSRKPAQLADRSQTGNLVDRGQPGALADSRQAGPLRLQEDRRRRWQQQCPQQPPGRVARFLVDSNHSLAYCAVPKAGSTFWINVFRFFVNDTGNAAVVSPSEISRVHTHYSSYRKLGLFEFSSHSSSLFRNKSLRFMFVRDPYSRLWSAYVDKFFLPDFWLWPDSRQIILRRQRDNSSQSALQKKLQCPDDISFQEFLTFVVENDPGTLNGHWLPVKQLCDPCLFKPHVLGTIETFGMDSSFILDLVGESWMLAKADHRARVKREMAMLTDYNFWVLAERTKKGCLTSQGLAERLWSVFVYNGYLSPTEKPHSRELQGATPQSFKKLAFEAYDRNPATPEQERERREAALKDAFRSVRRRDLLKLVDLYQEDFDLFGYNTYPAAVFGGKL